LADVTTLGQTNIYKRSLPGGTVEKALLIFRNFFVSYLQDFAYLHKEITENILQQVQKANKDHQKQHESHDTILKKSTQVCTSGLQKFKDAKKKLQKCKLEFEKSKERYQSSESDYQSMIKKGHHDDNILKDIHEPKIESITSSTSESVSHPINNSHNSSHNNSMSRLLAKRISSAYESNAKATLDRAQESCLHKYEAMTEALEEVKEAKQKYMEMFQEHESIVEQTRSKMESFDRDHVQSLKESLSKFAAVEKTVAERRVEAAIFLGEAVSQIEHKVDRDLLIQSSKVPDRTHKCSRALSLLDWDNQRRHTGVADYEKVGQIRSFESYVDHQSMCYSHFEMELPSLPFALPPADQSLPPVTSSRSADDEIARSVSHEDIDDEHGGRGRGSTQEVVEGQHIDKKSETVSSSSKYSFSSADLSNYFFGSKSRPKSSARSQRSDTVTSSTAVAPSSSSGSVVTTTGGSNSISNSNMN
jgi:hypothetical protein